MDEVVSISRSFLNELRGFLNLFAGQCSGCMRRSYENCSDCSSGRARKLMMSIDSSTAKKVETYFQQNPFIEHVACAISAIKEAGRPVRQSEIKIYGVSRQSLHWDLKKMCQRGYLMKVKTDFGVAYKIGPRKFNLQCDFPYNNTTTRKGNERWHST